MKNLILAALLLLVVSIVVITYSHWISKEPGEQNWSGYTEGETNVDFKVTGVGSLPVESVALGITVRREAEGQVQAKELCDTAAESMARLFADMPAAKLDPKGIEVDRETDPETKKARFNVARNFDLVLGDIGRIESVITSITRIEGCMIRSTEYRTSRLAEIRRMAVDDGKARMEKECADLLRVFGGASYAIKSVRIDDENRYTGGAGAALFALADTSTENLQHAQSAKHIEVRMSYDVSIVVRRKPAP